MRRLLALVALVAAVLLVPAAGAQAAVEPTEVQATWVPFTDPVAAHLSVSFTPLLLTNYTVLMCQSSATCTPVAVASGTTSPITAPVAVDGFGCRVQVTATDIVSTSDPAPALPIVVPQCDRVIPALAPSATGGNGCVPFVVSGTAIDQGAAVPVLADGNPVPVTVVSVAPFLTANVTVTATDPVGNLASAVVSGQVEDPSPPGPVSLELTTDPAAQKATLNWDPVVSDGAPVTYRLRTKGPQGPTVSNGVTSPVSFFNLEVDATYEYTLDAVDACNRLTSSVRLVRLNDTTPPSAPIVAGPSLNPASHVMALSWVASTDNIQVDHYVILRNGVPLGTTDATVFTDLVVPQRTQLSYVVRAVDTNGNSTDSAPAPIMTPDWTAPTAPVLTLSVQGTTATLRWRPAADNIGVVGYDVLRDNKQVASMTAAVRTYKDVGVPKGVHTWNLRARDDATLSALSAPQTARIVKPTARASVLSLRKVGGGSGAARYSLEARARLLVDLRVVGTVAKAKLRLYVDRGRGRITVWRGTPGTSAPKLRLGSALVRRGFVTISLSRTLHAGRIRLVLIPGGQVVIAGKGAHKPKIKTG